jgi:predicted RNase H-like HicB family nuclease
MRSKKHETSQEHSFTVLYEPVSGGGYQVTVPLLPGLVSYGRDIEEAKLMARDAIHCHIEGLRKQREKIPTERSLLQERLTISFAA